MLALVDINRHGAKILLVTANPEQIGDAIHIGEVHQSRSIAPQSCARSHWFAPTRRPEPAAAQAATEIKPSPLTHDKISIFSSRHNFFLFSSASW